MSSAGEFLALVDPDGETLVDVLNYGAQEPDVSYGRQTDGSDTWTFFSQPTPGTYNTSTRIESANLIPGDFALLAYPNPFNEQTVIRYDLPQAGLISLNIHDITGRIVKPLILKNQSAGSYTHTWNSMDDNGVSLSSGIYFIRLDAHSRSKTQKILILK